MNRQFAQILIGATALTGAFFFGSVMQRRHGDLETKAVPQPMLENEDLVWSTDPARSTTTTDPAAGPAGGPSSGSGEMHPYAASPNGLTTEHGGRGEVDSRGQDAALSAATGEAGSRMVVQPDFSRWTVPADSETAHSGRPSPLLPLQSPPQLLAEPNQPAGELVPQTTGPLPDSFESAFTPGTPATAEPPQIDPWTAPLSSVLLKPLAAPSPSDSAAVSGTSSGTSPQTLATETSAAERSAAQPMLSNPPEKRSSQSDEGVLVPVNHPFSPRIELDTDSFRVHVIRAGDTLQSLATKYYGSADFYLDIYLANQDLLDSPINLPSGKALKIPDYGK
jgi:phage tail protein X